MRILITGGCGFIGSHVAERLGSLGSPVAILDDFNDFYNPALKEANLEAIRRVADVALYRADIRDAEAVDHALADFAPEAVVHLAARAGIQPSISDPLLYEQVNCGGTLVVLEAARRRGVRQIVFASSSSVYGAAAEVPFREDRTPLAPISPYAATKIAGENFCATYSHLYAMRIACLRLFTVYGPRQRPDLAIRKFIELIDAGQPVLLNSDGGSARDYTFVSDIVDGIAAALEWEGRFGIFNLGNSSPITLRETIAAIEHALGKAARVESREAPPGDAPMTFADISKAKEALGYAPKVPFAEGIGRTVEWLRHRRRAAHS